MGDFLKDIDKLCGTQNNWIALPLTGSVIAGMEMILTIPLNAVIVYCLIKERKQKYKSLFYKLVLNIAICDLLTGLIADPIAIETFIKEAIKMKVALVEVYLIHLSLFITDAVALLTLSILSVERIVAIMLPVKHHKGVKRSIENGLIISAWILGSALVSPYFQLGFIRQLFVFSTVNIVVTVLSLVVTALTYNYKMKTKISTHSTATLSQSTDHLSVQFNGQRPESDADMANPNDTTSSTLNIRVISVQFNDQQQSDRDDMSNLNETKVVDFTESKSPSMTANQEERDSGEHTPTTTEHTPATTERRTSVTGTNHNLHTNENKKNQHKATRTFILMLCVFIATYLPTTFTMLYMNVCTECNCLVIHIMRDVSALSILSSSVLRPLNFILTLKHLRSSVFQIFQKA